MPGAFPRYSRGVKRLLLAGLLLLPALVRAESGDAYGSLVGMADGASSDKGPDAGELPKDEPAKASVPAPARKEKGDEAAAVTVPAPQTPRIWTRLFASLLPPMRRVAVFEVEASTAAPRARPATPRPATPASVAGTAQGLLEFVAATTAPASPDDR